MESGARPSISASLVISDGPPLAAQWPQSRPLRPAPDSGHAVRTTAAPGTSPGREILVVDDNADVRLLLRRLLERAGHTVHEAGSGEEGLDLFSRCGNRLALLLTDVEMRGMDGFQLASRILKVRSDLAVLFMSGGIPESAARTAFIAKPFENGELLRRIHERLI